jgi:WhiB family redox-sensing transcriptional regulator
MLELTPNDPTADWRFAAECRGEDSVLFYAPSYFERKEQKDAREDKARKICGRCEVRDECLTFALSTGETHGVWGGRNERERRLMLRGVELRAG